MYSRWQLAKKYLNYILTASNSKGHGMHSPFVYHFITKVLNDKTQYPAYNKIEAHRKQLLVNATLLSIEDFGAGSSINKTNNRSISSITKNAAKPRKYGQLLFRMVKEYQPDTILELGTSLGITSSYLSLAKPTARITTLEGAKEVADVAKTNFDILGLGNIKLVNGNFDFILADVLEEMSSVGLVFIDGNHRQQPTEKYFIQLLSKVHNETIMIFDDIHWSKEMEAAWQTIKEHPDVRCTIDLFFIGIVLFRKEFMTKQHFVIRF